MVSHVNIDTSNNITQVVSRVLCVILSLILFIIALWQTTKHVPQEIKWNFQSAPACQIKEEHRPMCTLDNAFHGLWKYDYNATEQLQWCPHNCDMYELTRDETAKCLRGKLLMFLGDSCMLRSFTAFHDILFPEEPVKNTTYCNFFNITHENNNCGEHTWRRRDTRSTGSSVEHIFLEKMWLKSTKINHPAAEEFNTTQEMIFDYLQKKSPDILFVNVGMHQTCMGCVEDVDSQLLWMLNLFKKLGSDMYWILTTAIDMAKQPGWAVQKTGPSTRNEQIEKLNAISRRVTAELDVPLVDAWTPSRFLNSGLHDDGVHMKEEFYNVLVRTFLSTYCKDAEVQKSCMGVKARNDKNNSNSKAERKAERKAARRAAKGKNTNRGN